VQFVVPDNVIHSATNKQNAKGLVFIISILYKRKEELVKHVLQFLVLQLINII